MGSLLQVGLHDKLRRLALNALQNSTKGLMRGTLRALLWLWLSKQT